MLYFNIEITEGIFDAEDDKSIKLFGIKVLSASGNTIREYPLLFERKEEAEALATTIIEKNVSICHIADIIEDLL